MKRALVMWSGGIDSTYILAKLLKETDWLIRAHHFVNRTSENRWPKERQAVESLRPKLKAIRQFAFSWTGIDWGSIPYPPFDMGTVNFFIGAVARNWECEEVYIGTSLEDGHNWERWNELEKTRDGIAYPFKDKLPKFTLHEAIPKKDEMKYLSDLGLLADCWSCRTPKGDSTCGECVPCQMISKI